MNWSKLVISAASLTLALGCGKVRDDAGDTDDPGGNGGASSDSSGVSGGSASGGRNGTGAGGAGAGNAGSGGVSGSGGASNSAGTTSSGGASSSGGAATSGGTTSTGGTLDTGGTTVEEEGTRAMRAGPTVWIGQAETVVTYPADLEEGRVDPQKMILILDRVASGVTGTITFGSGAPPPVPTDPVAPYPPGQTWTAEDGVYPVFNTNWMYSPYDGFSYSIVGSELRGNTLTLAFVPLELFASWCDIQADNGEVCDCNDGGCVGKTGPTRRLELVVSGTSLSGQLSRPPGNWFGETPALKLERIR